MAITAQGVRALLLRFGYEAPRIGKSVPAEIASELNLDDCTPSEMVSTLKLYRREDEFGRAVPNGRCMTKYLRQLRTDDGPTASTGTADMQCVYSLLESYGWDKTAAILSLDCNRRLKLFADGIGIDITQPYSGIDSWYVEYLKIKHEHSDAYSACRAAAMTAPTQKQRAYYDNRAMSYEKREPWTEEQKLELRTAFETAQAISIGQTQAVKDAIAKGR